MPPMRDPACVSVSVVPGRKPIALRVDFHRKHLTAEHHDSKFDSFRHPFLEDHGPATEGVPPAQIPPRDAARAESPANTVDAPARMQDGLAHEIAAGIRVETKQGAGLVGDER